MLHFARLISVAIVAFCISLSGQAQGLIRDAEIEAILREFTDPILVAAGLEPSDVQIFIIDDPALNAFVAGGQRIHLHTGLIIASETPGQLKGVIAHEAGHIAGAHGARRIQDIARAQRPAWVSIGLGVAAIAAGAPEIGAALIAGSQQYAALNFFAHTRVQEASADQAAITYLETLGESPAGLVEFFEKFRYQEVLSQARRAPYFRSHPLASDRIRAVRQRAEETGLMDIAPDPETQRKFEIMRAKLIGFRQVPARVYNAYPVTDLSEPARYARAISAFKSLDMGTALSEIDSLLGTDPDNPFYHELLGQVLFETSRVEESVAPLERAVELAPDESLIQIALARSLIARGEAGDLDRGETALRAALVAEPGSPFAYRELAIALEKQGRRGEAELATAEQAFHVGDIVSAHTFAQRAARNLDQGSTLRIRATDIIAITDPTLPENRRAFQRRR